MSSILLVCLSAVLLSLLAPVYKWGLKKTEVFCTSFLNVAMLFIILFIAVAIDGKLLLFEMVRNEFLLDILLNGTLFSIFILFLFLSLKYGALRLLIPLYSISFFYFLIFDRLIDSRGIDLICFLGCVLYIGGVVLMLLKNKKDRRVIKAKGILYALASVTAICVSHSLDKTLFQGKISDYDIKNVLICAVAMCVLFLLCILFQKLKDFKKCFKKDSVMKLITPAVLLIVCALLYGADEQTGTYSSIYCICLPVAVLFSCILHKEKYSIRAVVGIFLSTAGLFILSFFG